MMWEEVCKAWKMGKGKNGNASFYQKAAERTKKKKITG